MNKKYFFVSLLILSLVMTHGASYAVSFNEPAVSPAESGTFIEAALPAVAPILPIVAPIIVSQSYTIPGVIGFCCLS